VSFDEIDHAALMGLVRRRITDKRVLALIKAFLKAGIFSKETGLRDSDAGAPQGGIYVTAAGQHRPERAR
jgi:RNA-directed DNA polymerase